MEIRKITDTYAVSPQIAPEDLPAIAAAGFRTIICNRPDDEVPVELQSEALRIATEAAGLTFVDNPVTHAGLNAEMVRVQKEALEASDGPVFAYCASGNRSSIVWSLGHAGQIPVDEIIEATSRAGYDLTKLRPMLEAAARS